VMSCIVFYLFKINNLLHGVHRQVATHLPLLLSSYHHLVWLALIGIVVVTFFYPLLVNTWSK